MSKPLLPGARLKITELRDEYVTTDRGDKYRLSLPTEHVTGGHMNPRIDDSLTVRGPKTGIVLDLDALILVEIEGGCGCQNIGLRVVSLGAA